MQEQTVVFWFTDDLEPGEVVRAETRGDTLLYLMARDADQATLARELSVAATTIMRAEWLHVGRLLEQDRDVA